MGTKLSPHDAELYQRVDEVLHYVWDPIGVAGEPMARDEYYAYLPTVFSLLKQSADSREKIAQYLDYVVTDRMGLPENRKATLDVVDILLDWKERLDEKYDRHL